MKKILFIFLLFISVAHCMKKKKITFSVERKDRYQSVIETIRFDKNTPMKEIVLAIKNRLIVKSTKDLHGNTLLHFAVESLNEELFSMLIKKPYFFSTHEKNREQETPLTLIAALLRKKEIKHDPIAEEALKKMIEEIPLKERRQQTKKNNTSSMCCFCFW